MRAFLIETEALDAYAQMALDEAVLEHPEPDAVSLRLYAWLGRMPYAVTFGYSQPYREVMESVGRRGVAAGTPVVRRSTGGGIVWHDGDITFSLVFPWPSVGGPRGVYRRIHAGVRTGLLACGVRTLPFSGRPTAGLRAQCFAGPEPEDLVREDGTKLLGGALRRRRGTGLYQGSLRPEGLGVPREALHGAIVEGFSLQWSSLFARTEPRPVVAAAAEELRAQRYSREEWNQRR